MDMGTDMDMDMDMGMDMVMDMNMGWDMEAGSWARDMGIWAQKPTRTRHERECECGPVRLTRMGTYTCTCMFTFD
jgi:hypothetical protein